MAYIRLCGGRGETNLRGNILYHSGRRGVIVSTMIIITIMDASKPTWIIIDGIPCHAMPCPCLPTSYHRVLGEHRPPDVSTPSPPFSALQKPASRCPPSPTYPPFSPLSPPCSKEHPSLMTLSSSSWAFNTGAAVGPSPTCISNVASSTNIATMRASNTATQLASRAVKLHDLLSSRSTH